MNKNWLLSLLVLTTISLGQDTLPSEEDEEMISAPKAEFLASQELYIARAEAIANLRSSLNTCRSLFDAQYKYGNGS